jgi:hypothetical protein
MVKEDNPCFLKCRGEWHLVIHVQEIKKSIVGCFLIEVKQ